MDNNKKSGLGEVEKKKRDIEEIPDKIDMDNGNFPYAKDIGRTLAKTTLTGSHRAIIDCILDKTYGWYDPKSEKVQKLKKRKTKEQITYRNFEDFTGIKRTKLSKYILKLVNCKVIKRLKKGQYFLYSLNINVRQWDKSIFKESIPLTGDTSKYTPNRGHPIPLTGDTLYPQRGTLEDFKTNEKVNKNKALRDSQKPPKETIKRNYIKKEEKGPIYIDKKLREEKEIFDYWNSLDIIPHKIFKAFKDDIKEALKNYSLEEIKNSIKNYSLILRGEGYLYTYKHTISGFLKPKKFEEFKDLERAKENNLIRRVNGETEAVEYERYKPEPMKKETEEERKARYKKSVKRINELKNNLKKGFK